MLTCRPIVAQSPLHPISVSEKETNKTLQHWDMGPTLLHKVTWRSPLKEKFQSHLCIKNDTLTCTLFIHTMFVV